MLFAVLLAILPAAAGSTLSEPSEAELRRAYLDFLYDFVAVHGDPVDPGCSLERTGCSVKLVDVRRDYRLVSFKKSACTPAAPAGFACSFEAKVTCAYSAKAPASPAVADLYCEPVFNKVSTYIAELQFDKDGWVITRFLQS